MIPSSYALTFACYNQVDYTRQCVDSMRRHGPDLSRLVVIDNGSQDDTRNYLETLPLGGRILNRQNLGCGVAWNQGALALQAEWTVVMNNDVIVSAGWLERLIASAEQHQLKVVSPALIEGPLDYDFDDFAAKASQKMAGAVRRGGRHAVCMAIHQSVWDAVGYFRATPSLWGYEDTLFFNQLEKAGIATGIVGSSWLHHYGSITLSAIKRERGLRQKDGLSARTTYRLLEQSFIERKWKKHQRKKAEARWRAQELEAFGMTLHGQRENGDFRWQ
ncbi:MAG TPA: glycosyltransferase [Ramlibacter sp.]|nr:glycosyltransferase [Ramlibacter sp.]